MRSKIGILLLGTMAACTAPATEPATDTETRAEPAAEARIGEPFILAPGESATISGALLEVRFIDVVADSRCPTDVTCVWEGDAEVAVRTVRGATDRAWRLHTTGPPAGGPSAIDLGGYTLELVGVEPQPLSGQPIPRDRYRVTLRVVEATGG